MMILIVAILSVYFYPLQTAGSRDPNIGNQGEHNEPPLMRPDDPQPIASGANQPHRAANEGAFRGDNSGNVGRGDVRNYSGDYDWSKIIVRGQNGFY